MTAIEDARAALARYDDPNVDAWGYQECNRQRHLLATALRALADEHERLAGELSARDAEDVRRSEEGRTDWDYQQRIAALTVNPDAPIPYAGHGPEYVVNLAPPTVEHHYPDGSYDVDWATPPTDDEHEALADLIASLRLQGTRHDNGSKGHPTVPDRPGTWNVTQETADEWADAVLAAGFRLQGPITEAQVEAAARVSFELPNGDGDYTWAEMVRDDPTRADIWRADARAILEAARDVS
jgi:hypothetical protein